jgi:ADP-heptose:LPS heptosyltransferase
MDEDWIRPGEQYAATIKRCLKLPADSMESWPTLRPEYYEKAKAKFESHHLPYGKTVVLFPSTNSTTRFPDEIWQTISKIVRSKGWEICVNTQSKCKIPHVKRVYFPLEEAIPLVEMAGWFISQRSGICDILESAKCRKTVLYPKEGDSSESQFIVRGKLRKVRHKYSENFSLKNRAENVEEFLISEKDWQHSIERIFG